MVDISTAISNFFLILNYFLGVYCTEPFRIPFAGKIDICAFDKTGTLTSDNLVVEGVAGLKSGSSALTPIDALPLETVQVLASCHSLVRLDTAAPTDEEGLLGDPLEKVCLAAADWSLTKNDAVIPKTKGQVPLKIVQRYHFSSALKRMSVVCSCIRPGTADPVYLATVKGAPELLKGMFSEVPDNYDEVIVNQIYTFCSVECYF